MDVTHWIVWPLRSNAAPSRTVRAGFVEHGPVVTVPPVMIALRSMMSPQSMMSAEAGRAAVATKSTSSAARGLRYRSNRCIFLAPFGWTADSLPHVSGRDTGPPNVRMGTESSGNRLDSERRILDLARQEGRATNNHAQERTTRTRNEQGNEQRTRTPKRETNKDTPEHEQCHEQGHP